MSLLNRLQALVLGNGDEGENAKAQARAFILSFPGMQRSLGWLHTSRIVDPSEQIYEDVSEYIRNGQVHNFEVKLLQLVRVVRNGQTEFGTANTGFRMLLWHGTKKGTIAPILTNGFNLPEKKGQMFGPGVYFADRVSKSCQYCKDGNETSNWIDGYLFLCDVLLGKMYNARRAHNQYTEAPKGFKQNFDSVMCTGEFVPDRETNRETCGSIIPCGPTIENDKFETYRVKYNEYIVYDTSKIRIKYVVHVKFGNDFTGAPEQN